MDKLVPAWLLADAAIPVAPAFSAVPEFDSKKAYFGGRLRTKSSPSFVQDLRSRSE